MASLNKVMLMGNLTRDPELKYTPTTVPFTEVCVAVNRSWTGDNGQRHEEVTFINLTFWNRQAETLCQYARKGTALYIEGRLQLDSWKDAQTDKNRTALKVVGERFQFLGPKPTD